MPEVTVCMGLWIVTAPEPMTTASKSALSLKPRPPVLSRRRRRRREEEEGRERGGGEEEGRDSMRVLADGEERDENGGISTRREQKGTGKGRGEAGRQQKRRE